MKILSSTDVITPTVGSNNTKIASTAFVNAEIENALFGQMDGGKPSSIYLVADVINGGNANGV